MQREALSQALTKQPEVTQQAGAADFLQACRADMHKGISILAGLPRGRSDHGLHINTQPKTLSLTTAFGPENPEGKRQFLVQAKRATRNAERCRHSGSLTLNIFLLYNPAIALLGVNPKE